MIFCIRCGFHSNTTFKENKGCTTQNNKNKNKHSQDNNIPRYLITVSSVQDIHTSLNGDGATKRTQLFKAFYYNISQLHLCAHIILNSHAVSQIFLCQINKINLQRSYIHSATRTHCCHTHFHKYRTMLYFWKLTAYIK